VRFTIELFTKRHTVHTMAAGTRASQGWGWAPTPNLPPRSTRGGPFLLIVCVRSHRCTGFKKRDTTEAALLARAASGLSLVADERGGLISSRTARGVRVNLVLAMVFHRHVRRKAVLFAATRAQAAEAGLMLHKLASSWLRGEASMDSYSTRRLTSAMNNMCSALVTSAVLGATHFAPHSAVC